MSKHVLPPECIIRIENMAGKEIYNRKHERDQKMAYLARRKILQEEGEAIARRAATAEGVLRETVGEPSASSAEPSGPEPEPTPRAEPPVYAKNVPPGAHVQIARDHEAKIKAQKEKKAAEAAAVDEATQPRQGAVPPRFVEFANRTQAPPWQTSEIFQAQRVLSKVSGIRKFSRSQVAASGERHSEKKARPVFIPR